MNIQNKEQPNCMKDADDKETAKKELSSDSDADIYKKYSLTGKKLSQQEIDILVARYKRARKC
ncbi:MAG: hypothetical protein NT129_04605 [Candidatus Aenigmarchaeota archaeon]|nr:hypothetical protein [Candidatus Aenigmarchaeota archaeon]